MCIAGWPAGSKLLDECTGGQAGLAAEVDKTLGWRQPTLAGVSGTSTARGNGRYTARSGSVRSFMKIMMAAVAAASGVPEITTWRSASCANWPRSLIRSLALDSSAMRWIAVPSLPSTKPASLSGTATRIWCSELRMYAGCSMSAVAIVWHSSSMMCAAVRATAFSCWPWISKGCAWFSVWYAAFPGDMHRVTPGCTQCWSGPASRS